jgi:tetratricopeptide (TPR) repeat protein
MGLSLGLAWGLVGTDACQAHASPAALKHSSGGQHRENSQAVVASSHWAQFSAEPKKNYDLADLADPEAPRAASPAVSNSALNAQWMFELLLGEMNINEGQALTGLTLLLDVAKKSGDEKLFERSVEIALQSHSADAALEVTQSWRVAHPKSLAAHEFSLQIFIALNRLSDAQQSLEKLLSLTPKGELADTIKSLPRSFARSSNKHQAVLVLQAALEPFKSSKTLGAVVWSTLGQMHLIAQEPQDALKSGIKAHQLNPMALEPLWLALGLMEQRQSDAESFLTPLMAQKPNPYPEEVVFAYARVLLEAERMSEGIQALTQLTQEHPNFASAWLFLGSAYADKGFDNQARSHWLHYLSLDAAQKPLPSREKAQAYLGLAQSASKRGELNESLQWLAKIDDPNLMVNAQIQKALVLNKKGQPKEALDLVNALPNNTPEASRRRVLAMVQIARDQSRFDLALELLEKAAAERPLDDDLMYELGMAYEKINRLEAMEKTLQALTARTPTYYAAFNAWGYALADRALKLPQAKTLIVKALEMAPEDPFIMDSLGWVEFRLGHLKDALAILKKAYSLRADSDIAAHLAEVMVSLGLKTEASSLVAEAQKTPTNSDVLNETIKRLGIKTTPP